MRPGTIPSLLAFRWEFQSAVRPERRRIRGAMRAPVRQLLSSTLLFAFVGTAGTLALLEWAGRGALLVPILLLGATWVGFRLWWQRARIRRRVMIELDGRRCERCGERDDDREARCTACAEWPRAAAMRLAPVSDASFPLDETARRLNEATQRLIEEPPDLGAARDLVRPLVASLAFDGVTERTAEQLIVLSCTAWADVERSAGHDDEAAAWYERGVSLRGGHIAADAYAEVVIRGRVMHHYRRALEVLTGADRSRLERLSPFALLGRLVQAVQPRIDPRLKAQWRERRRARPERIAILRRQLEEHPWTAVHVDLTAIPRPGAGIMASLGHLLEGVADGMRWGRVFRESAIREYRRARRADRDAERDEDARAEREWEEERAAHLAAAAVPLDRLPTREEIEYGGGLDEEWAAKNFLGKTIEQATEMFRSDRASGYCEDLMWMGPVARRYYLEAVERALRTPSEDVDELIDNLPAAFEWLLEDQWDELRPCGDRLVVICDLVLALIPTLEWYEDDDEEPRARYEKLRRSTLSRMEADRIADGASGADRT